MSAVTMVMVAPDDGGVRLDRWFKKHYPAFSYIQVEKMLRKGQIRIDGKRAKAATRLEPGQEIRVPPMPERSNEDRPAKTASEQLMSPEEMQAVRDLVIYKDDSVLAINKPAGLAVQGGTGLSTHLDAMLEALRYEKQEKPRLVHRLDKDTSGVLLLARNAPAARKLTEAFKGKSARKVYWALVSAVPPQKKGWIYLPLEKQAGGQGEKMVVDYDNGKEALTLYSMIDKAGRKAAWVALMPLTGRTHQLRAHCGALEAPILGDGKYGGKKAYPLGENIPKDMMLHAREIAVPHPDDGTTLRIQAALSPHMVQAWKTLGFNQLHGEGATEMLEGYAADLSHCPPRELGDFFKPKKQRY
ncbi:RluA family pseudouridine synthase [Kiloniella laminariae]|uniref:Pseudouridine synthase n=1 Tax=Kiloniella laminariae TaxID=454162 RepID=A0ABT4LPC8_9PROT|nr:RluA family pseudouridine synthase [Kiloniella laminariae]MCZ4282984.1 RluA family pseudouridine synthase [Kiloniella laminariae]